MQFDAKDISLKLNDHIHSLCETIFQEKPKKIGNNLRFRKNNKISIYTSGPKKGHWINFETGECGNMLTLLKIANGGDFIKACQEAQDFLGENQKTPNHHYQDPEIEKIKTQEEQEKKRKAAQNIYKNSHNLTTQAYAYLKNRKIDKIHCTLLKSRFSKTEILEKFYKENIEEIQEPQIESLVCPFTNQNNEITAIQQIFLQNGKKAPLITPKKMTGSSIGSAFKIIQNPKSQKIIITEGIETGLAIAQSLGENVWCAGGSYLLNLIEIPKTITHIIYAQDRDHAGQEALERIKKSYTDKKIYNVLCPEIDTIKKPDFNDLLIHYGEEKVIETFKNQILKQI